LEGFAVALLLLAAAVVILRHVEETFTYADIFFCNSLHLLHPPSVTALLPVTRFCRPLTTPVS
jgi:hypothetical protein